MPKQNTSQLERANRAATALGYSGVEGARQVIKKRSTQLGMNGTDQNRMTMSADTLNANPTEFAVQDAPPATESGALAGALEKQPDYTKQLAEQAKKAQTGEQRSFQELLNAQLGMEGQTSLTDTQYSQQGGVDDLTKKLNEYDQQLTMEQNSTRRRVEQIQKNSVGMSQQALNDEVDRVERESLAKQADISVIRAGVAQDYATAKSIADRAVTVAMEKQKMKLDVLGLNYTRNKDLFTKAEQRAFESAQTDRTNAYNETLASKKAISDYSLEAMKMGADGATISAIRSAKTPEEAQALAASYISPLVQQQNALDVEAKRAQIASANRANQPSEKGPSWSERASILKLAEMGDPVAIEALGYDPADSPTKQNAQTVARDSAMKELDKVNGLVNNALGISSSSGTIQSPLLAQMLGLGATGAGAGAAGGALVGGVGAIPGAIGGGILGLATGAVTGADAKRKKEDFLSQVDFVLSGDSFDKFRELKQGGVTFGQTTEREWTAVQKAANELESFAKRDSDGKLTGFKGSEDSLRRMLIEYQTKAQKFADSFDNGDGVVDQGTMDEINAIFGDTTSTDTAFNPLSYY